MKTLKLIVPKLKQSNKGGCGPTSLAMVMNYFGKNETEESILHALGGVIDDDKNKKWGTLSISNALYATKNGFEVFCYTYDIADLKYKWSDLSNEELAEKIEGLSNKTKDKTKKLLYDTFVELYRNKNAHVIFKRPSLVDIDLHLQQGLPVMVATNTKTLYEKDGFLSWDGHSIVLTGSDVKSYYYNNPANGDSSVIDKEHLLFSLSNNVIDSSAYMLVIKPKK
jgi:uncharacterized protein YvpB